MRVLPMIWKRTRAMAAGIPPPPAKEIHAEKRADAWYARMKDTTQGFKHVAINDEMASTNMTVVHMLHEVCVLSPAFRGLSMSKAAI